MKAYKKSRKGSFQDALFIVIMLFVISIIFAVVQTAQKVTMESMNDTGDMGSSAEAIMDDTLTDFPKILETIFSILVFGLGIGAVILSFQINSHPAFFFVFFLAIVAVVIVTPVFSNVWEEVISDSEISAATGGLSMTNFILVHYPRVMMVISMLIAIVMFAKGGGGDGV